MKKIVIIGGQTATGKTALAVKLANKFSGELVSADSRQVYQGLDIVTGKDIAKIWLYDGAKPDYQFNVGQYRELAGQAIENILSRRRLPIVVGGTGLYLQSLIKPLENIFVKPDEKLRKKLGGLTVRQLQKLVGLEKLSSMNNSDKNNPRRLMRMIEVGKSKNKKNITPYDYLAIILFSQELKKRIAKRVEKRIGEGAIEETEGLLKRGFDFNLPAFSATGYLEVKKFLEKKLTLEETKNQWIIKELQYAKRQMVWFKKYFAPSDKVFWFDTEQVDFYTSVENLIWRYLQKPSF